MTRSDQLLSAAASALDDGVDPLAEGFLIEHDVTLTECYSLAESLALGARVLLSLKRDIASGGLAAQVAGMRLAEAVM